MERITKNQVLGLFMIASLFLTGCSLMFDAISQAIPQSNEVTVIEKTGNPEKSKKVMVIFKPYKLSPQAQYKWKTEHIPKALKEAGILNFEIVESEDLKRSGSEVNDSYMLLVTVNGWTAKRITSGDSSRTDLWLAVTASLFNLPSNDLVVKVGGNATDSSGFNVYSIGEMCCSLLQDMLKKMYSA